MKLYILILMLLTSFSSYSQNELKRKDLSEKYSWNNSTTEERNHYYFGLRQISLSDKQYHFRYEKSSQIIDLYSEDGIEFKGQITNIIQENKDVKTDYGIESKAYNYLFEQIKIPSDNASIIGQLILKEMPYLIPTDAIIKNWSFSWTDCGAIDFNYKVESDFYNKYYTCLQNQKDSVAHVLQIKKLKDTISITLNLKQSYDDFNSRLPKGASYTIDGWINMYIMTEKQVEQRHENKPIRDYKKIIKDTIDNYLESELNLLIPNLAEIDCFDDYRLTFSKYGRLKNMKVDMAFLERLFDKDYKKCRRILKSAFREIRIDFVDLKYPFQRDLCFGQKEIYITDPTLY